MATEKHPPKKPTPKERLKRAPKVITVEPEVQGKGRDQAATEAEHGREDQPAPVRPVLRTYRADCVNADGEAYTALVNAFDDDQARELIGNAFDLQIRNVWQSSDKPHIVGLFESQHLK